MMRPRLNRPGKMSGCIEKDQSLVVVLHLEIYQAKIQEIACLKI